MHFFYFLCIFIVFPSIRTRTRRRNERNETEVSRGDHDHHHLKERTGLSLWGQENGGEKSRVGVGVLCQVKVEKVQHLLENKRESNIRIVGPCFPHLLLA